MVGVVGWLDTPLPTILTVGWQLVAIATAVAAFIVSSLRQRLVLLALAAAVLAFPVLSEALRARELGYIWQGRYTLPLAVGLPLIATALLARSEGPERRWNRSALAIIVATAIVQTGALAIWLRRTTVGSDHPVLSALGHRPYPQLVAPVLILAVGTTAVVGWSAWMATRRSVGPIGEVDGPDPSDC